MAQLCEQHNLVLANDGRCVLCRRAQRRYLSVTPRAPSTGDRILTAALGTGLLAALGMLLWALQLPEPDTAPRFDDASTARLSVDELPANADPAPAPEVESALSSPAETVTAAPADEDKAEAPRAGAQQQEHAQKQARALRAAQRAVEQEKRAVPITMYSTSWCTICETSRYYLMGRELTYTEQDIERDPAAAKRMARVNAARSVPTFVIDGQVLVGFNAWQLEGALETAARKRMAEKPGVACAAEAPCADDDAAKQ